MGTGNGVTIIVAGEDKTGEVFAAVQAHMEKVTAAAAETSIGNKRLADSSDEVVGSGRRLQTQLGLVDNAMRGQTSRALADIIRGMSKFGIVMDLLPIAATVAGLAILGKMVLEVGKQFGSGGNEMIQANNKLLDFDDSLAATNADLKLTLDKELQAKAISDGRPFDGLRISADETAVAVSRLQTQLNGVTEKELAFLQAKQFKGSFLQQMFGIKGGTDYEQTLMLQHQAHLLQSTSVSDELAESKSYGATLAARARELKWRTTGGAGRESPMILSDLRSELKAVEQMIAWQKAEQTYVQRTIDIAANKPTEKGRHGGGTTGSGTATSTAASGPDGDQTGNLWLMGNLSAPLSAPLADAIARQKADAQDAAQVAAQQLQNQIVAAQAAMDKAQADEATRVLSTIKDQIPKVILAPVPGNKSGINMAAIQGVGERVAHSVFDPLFSFNASWNQKWHQMVNMMGADLGKLVESQLFGALFGDPNGRGGKGWAGTSWQGNPNRPGLSGEGTGMLGELFGKLFKKPASVVSNGGVGSGPGTIPSATASLLGIGNKAAGSGGVQVVLNNNGAPMQVGQTSQSGGNDGEQKVIQIMLKQFETNGPVATGVQGIVSAAMGML